jgi:formamidopyrimidine-DNA glycosylase
MPELPDLTVFAENLQRRLRGKRVRSVVCPGHKRLNVAPEALSAALTGREVEQVGRAGKEVEFIFSQGVRLLIHLMLSGRFAVLEKPQHLADRMLLIQFEDGSALAVTDPKGLVKIALNPPPADAPDALQVRASYLRRKAAERPRTLAKAFLIDQAILRGIGNAYADEILWRARISPKAAVGRIPEGVMEELVVAIGQVLTEAIEQIRTAAPEITGGELRDFLLIHQPRHTQSPTGHPIIKEKVASKTTYFTDEQILY